MRKMNTGSGRTAERVARPAVALLFIPLLIFALAGGLISLPGTAEASGTITSCAGCHGNAPVDSATRDGATGRFPGSHDTHAGSGAGQYGMNCEICHFSPNYTSYAHQADTMQLSLRWFSMAGGVVQNGSVTGWGSYSKGTNFWRTNTNIQFGNCTNTYCHSNGTGGTLNAGENRPIAANTSFTWWSGNGPTCVPCHGGETGNPGTGVPWYTSRAWLSKANSHRAHAATGAAGVCNKCHFSTTNTGNTITSVGQHIKRSYSVQPNTGAGVSFTYTYGVTGGSCSSISCHGNATWGGPGMDCVSCHGAALNKTKGGTSTIRQVTGAGGDFTKASRHLLAATTIIKWDCVICHSEGLSSDGKTDGTYHNDTSGLIDLRNVDTAALGWSINNKAWRTIDYAALDQFCVTCHDANGAAGINVNGTNNGVNLATTRQFHPFNTTDYIYNAAWGTVKGSTWKTGVFRKRVVNVKDQFYAGTQGNWATTNYNGNPSQHAVLGTRYGTKNPNWGTTVAWTTIRLKKMGTILMSVAETALLTCADCHVLDSGSGAHGGTNPYLLWNSTTGGVNGICMRCHGSTYEAANAGGSRFKHGYNRGNPAYGLDHGGSSASCFHCHAGWASNAGINAPVTGGGYNYGGIHGIGWASSASTYQSAASVLTAYRFIPGTYRRTAFATDGAWTTRATYQCYFPATGEQWAACAEHSAGSDTTNYTPGYARPVKY